MLATMSLGLMSPASAAPTPPASTPHRPGVDQLSQKADSRAAAPRQGGRPARADRGGTAARPLRTSVVTSSRSQTLRGAGGRRALSTATTARPGRLPLPRACPRWTRAASQDSTAMLANVVLVSEDAARLRRL